LNGLSFCVLDTIAQKILLTDNIDFKTESTPYLALKELKHLVEKHGLLKTQFNEVSVVHKNNLFCLVPKALFDKEELPNYLKFNTKILANDQIVYDVVPNKDIVCVYVPFTNINNYLFECFGEFDYKHSSLAMLQTLFQQKGNKTIAYVHVSHKSMEIAIMEHNNILLYNQFDYATKEDFLYYILFTYEQMGLDVEQIKLKLFGDVEEGDERFDICYQYIKKVAVFVPKHTLYDHEAGDRDSIDLTLLGNY